MSIQRKHSGERSIIEPKTKRDFCLRELVETEKNYVEALKMIIKVIVIFFFKCCDVSLCPSGKNRDHVLY